MNDDLDANYARAGYHHRLGFGRRPALLLIDNQSGTMQLNHDPSHLEFQAHTKQAAAK